MKSRLQPPFWQHDWYTLSRLRSAIETSIGQISTLLPCGDILDFGAGDAPYKPLFAALGKNYLEADLNADAPVVISLDQPLPVQAGSQALVVSFQVLEHVWDLDWYLGEARRVLHEEGHLLLSTHGAWLYHPHPTDFRRWTRDGLLREIESRGFTVTNVQSLVGPLAWTTQFRALGFHQIASQIPLLGPLISALVCAIYNARMKIEDAVTPAAIRNVNSAVYVVLARKNAL